LVYRTGLVVSIGLSINKEPFFHVIGNIENFNNYKFKLLDIINNAPCDPPFNNEDNNYKTDYYVKNNRPYADFLFNITNSYFSKLANELSFDPIKLHIKVSSLWFQQYKNKGTHGWHTHGDCNFTNVLYIEKPDSLHTEFYCPITKQFIYFNDIKEGSILTFPGYILHRSPKNTCDQTKTIISFNTELTHNDTSN